MIPQQAENKTKELIELLDKYNSFNYDDLDMDMMEEMEWIKIQISEIVAEHPELGSLVQYKDHSSERFLDHDRPERNKGLDKSLEL